MPNKDLLSIHYVDSSRSAPEQLPIEKYIALLDEQSLKRYNRISSEPNKLRFLLGRVLLKSLIADFLACAVHDVVISESPNGRPELKSPSADLSFNLSHSKNIIIAAAAAAPLGIDIEHTKASRNFQAIAEHYFSKDEAAHIFSGPPKNSALLFYHYWTLKEAFVKSESTSVLGLTPAISFRITNNKIEFLPDGDHQFISFQPKENYISAIALNCSAEKARQLKASLREIIPFVSQKDMKLQALGSTSGFFESVAIGDSK